MPLDPLVGLASSIAESPGAYCLLVGAGISQDAGVPTGQEVLWETVNRLHLLEVGSPAANQQDLENWFNSGPVARYSYSQLLGALFQTQEERRKYLEAFFVGKTPSPTHEGIARLIAAGYLKVVISTNFDPLLERAFDGEGLIYDIVASVGDLRTTRPREQSPCRLLKIHGDYRSADIRNTPTELEAYPGPLARELQEIIDRYGVVVVGYGGQDPGLMRALMRRRSLYSLNWVSRAPPTQEIRDLVVRTNGRIILRQSAQVFFDELETKLAVLKTTPEGVAPHFVVRETWRRIASGNRIAIDRDTEMYARMAELGWRKWYEQHRLNPPQAEPVLDLLDVVSPLEAVGLASTYAEDRVLVKSAIRILGTISAWQVLDLPGGFATLVRELPNSVAHHLWYMWGATALRHERMEALDAILKDEVVLHIDSNHKNKVEGGIAAHLDGLKYPFLGRVGGQKWEPTRGHAKRMPYVFKEFYRDDKDLFEALVQFDFTASVLRVHDGFEPFPTFGLNAHLVLPLLARIELMPSFGASYARIFGLRREDWISSYDGWMGKIKQDPHFGLHGIPMTWASVRQSIAP